MCKEGETNLKNVIWNAGRSHFDLEKNIFFSTSSHEGYGIGFKA